MTDILFPVGRLVAGHPMKAEPRINDQTKQPQLDATGQPVTERYIGVAIAKAGETHWNQTVWGKQILAAAQDPVSGWTNGEIGMPAFAWKIVDGDSMIPNKAGKKPAEQEGYPGHWVINMTTRIAYNCYHTGKYDPMQAIQDVNEIKCGDYVQVYASVKGNKPSQSPGIYINPQMLRFDRAGQQIIRTSGPSAADVFGGVTAAPAVQAAPPAPPVTPAYDLVQPGAGVTPPPPPVPVEPSYNVNGTVYTKSQLLAMPGWTEAHLANLQQI